ncbi:MAG: hypothetical protein ACYTFA_15590 [Planctomycetota bacterium]|jgi:hypothetical protein
MLGKSCRPILLSIVLVAGSACNQKLTTTDVQLAQMEETRATPRPYLSHMVDNAIARDMSVVDFHFVGHTSELSGTGVARLDRMAHFLDAYGGTVRYETLLTDDELINQRLAYVREYLGLTGCNMERVEVTTMISGGRGMPATKAIEIDEQGAKPEAEGGAGQPLGLLGG